jgi:phosphatidylinositol 3-kinase
MVPNCVSLSSLVEQKKTLLEYVCDQNDGVSVASLRRRLMESIAFSGAISWFFGFGDRHLDNIMVTKEGSLFHIDFGFCFGREPKMGVPRIRIT